MKLISTEKLKEVLSSRNFFLNLVMLLILGFTANDIQLNLTPEEIYNVLTGPKGGSLMVAVLTYFLNPLIKVIEKIIRKEFDWSFIRSSNFITQVMTVVAIVGTAVLGEEMWGILTSLVMNVANLLSHLRKPPKVEASAVYTSSEKCTTCERLILEA